MPEVSPQLPLNGEVSVLPIEIKDIRIRRGRRILLDIQQFSLVGNGITALIGPNGAGKTLLLRVISGLQEPTTGRVTWSGKKPSRRGYRNLGVVTQFPVLLRRSVRSNVEFMLRVAGYGRNEISGRTAMALKAAGLEDIAASSARILSGGERQRLALARVLSTDPEVLLLDEPTASTDPNSTLAIENMIREARDRGTRILLITHDVAQARRLADDIMLMHQGQVIEQSPVDRFFFEPETEIGRAFVAGDIVMAKPGER